MERQAKDGTVYQLVGQDEWQPVTRKAKDGTVYKKVGQDDWAPMESKESSGGVLDTIVAVGKKIDSYTGAPTRAAIGAIQDDKNPIGAFASQFGEDPDRAPTGKQIAQKAGVPNTSLSEVVPSLYTEDDKEAEGWLKFKKGGAADISASGAAGLGIDLAADPTNFIPVGKVASGLGSAAKFGAKGTAKVASNAGDLALATAKKLPGASKVSTTLDIAKEGAKNTTQALKSMFTPKVADDFTDSIRIAKKHGIDPKLLPESVEFGQGSFISRAARNRAEGVLGEPHLKRFEQGLEAVRDATENTISKIGGGYVPSSVEAGEIIRKGFDDSVDTFFNQVGMTHNKVMESIPGLTLSPEGFAKIESKLSGLEAWAKGRSVRGITASQRAQADQILKAVEAVRAGNGSYKQTVEALRDIGEVAFKSQNVLADIPPDIKKFRDLYFTLDDALIDTVEKSAGLPVAKELRESNKAITDFLGEKSVISSIVGNKNMSPEKVFSTLVENGDTRKIEALKKLLPPETFRQLKGAFLASQIRRNADDVFSFKTFNNSLRNKKNVLGAILDPNEINELSEVVRLGSRFGEPVLSTSGTGASNLFSDITSGIRSGVESDTVIGLLKDSARNRSAKAAAQVAQKSSQEVAKAAPLLTSKSSEALKRLANFSPIAVSAGRASTIKKEEKERGPAQLKGSEKWARDGAEKLKSSGIKDQTMIDELMKSKKGKSLLVRASDLSPNSKAMQNLIMQIKKELKGGA